MANERDCENCVHKVNGACTAWECKFEPKRGITKEEAIEIIECGEISNRWGKDGKEIEEMAIKALKQMPSISEDGTLTVNVEDGSKVSRVLVCGDNHFGGLYYPEQEPCDKCVYSTSEGCQYDDITETIPPLEDCVSKQAVAEVLLKYAHDEVGKAFVEFLLSQINDLPPVTPQPKSECEHDHEILKAYSDGANEVLDIIKAEIDEQYDRVHPYDISCAEGLEMALNIIDKYREPTGTEEG